MSPTSTDISNLKNIPEVYIQLRDLMNSLAFGYGATKEGYEFPLLMRFFSEEDAKHVLEMKPDRFFSAEDYASWTGRPVDKARTILDDMSERGLIYRQNRQGQPHLYHVAPVAHGFLEFNVGNVAKDVAEGKDDWLINGKNPHAGEIWGSQWFGSTEVPFFRAIPVNKNIAPNGKTLPYDDAEEIIRSKSKFAVSLCLCRIDTAAAGGYDDPRKETCLAFDDMAQYYIDCGIGRELTMQEALDLVRESVEMGYCIHVANSKNAEVMCSCNANVCGLLKASAAFGGDAVKHVSHYRVEIDRGACVGCGACVNICPVEVCSLDQSGKSTTNHDLCVGCGQCVIHCAHNARKLIVKEADEILKLNDTIFDTYSEMEKIRHSKGEI
jgi:NAD-dependent dihydropyrimidine dehydrogenase PreA subunit